MLDRKQFDKIKHKQTPTMQDVAVLIVMVEQQFRVIDVQAMQIEKASKSLDILRRRLEWYREVTVKEVVDG